MARTSAAPPRVLVDGVEFDSLTATQVTDRVATAWSAGHGGIIITPNVDILRQLRRPDLRHLASSAALVVADGAPVTWAARLRGASLPERVTGAQLVWHLAEAAQRHDRSIFLLGAGAGVAERAAVNFTTKFSGLRVAGVHSPPPRFEALAGEFDKIDRILTKDQPDIVFVSLGFPRQEKLAVQLSRNHPRLWFLCCGGAMDMAAGDVPRAHPILQRIGAEWLHRLAHEPRRLARRYIIDDLPYTTGLLVRSWLERPRANARKSHPR